eukprot:5003477-Pleurochrysis_carterae.AAC.1
MKDAKCVACECRFIHDPTFMATMLPNLEGRGKRRDSTKMDAREDAQLKFRIHGGVCQRSASALCKRRRTTNSPHAYAHDASTARTRTRRRSIRRRSIR